MKAGLVSIPYTAGFLDGEGCVGLSIARGRGNLRLHVDIANTQRAVLSKLQERWGGSVSRLSRGSERRKKSYYLRVSGHGAVRLLQAVFPYLLVKRRQALLAFKWAKLERFASPGQGVRLPKALLRSRIALKRQMHVLNHRGPSGFRETRFAGGFVGGIKIGRVA